MFTTPVDDRSNWKIVEIIEAPAYQRKSLGGQVDDRRRKVEPAVEPWLNRVLIRRKYVGQMICG